MPFPRALTDVPPERFEALAEELGEKRFVGRNLARWVFQRRATTFDAMTDLSRGLRARLAERFVVRGSRIVASTTCSSARRS